MSVFTIGFVIFPNLTQLDFTGPLQVLARLPQSATHIVAKSGAPVPATVALASCRRIPLRPARHSI
jgi:cyclohexyl-isocyanide hydratase